MDKMIAVDWWNDRARSERLALMIGIPVFIVSLVVAAVFVFRPSYEVLFSGLAPQDVTSIANQLTAEGVGYKVDEEGGKILVTKRDVHDTRMKVMEAGIPLNRPIGFELFDNVDFGMTEFTQRINYQRALEGELTRTISALKEVERARLHLVLPEERLFASEATQPKAALTLSIKPNMRLSAERISGIQRLIASSVPGLLPEAVAIHDDKGASLVGDQSAAIIGSINARVDAKRAVESYLSDKAQAVLNRSFGPGNAVVAIDADLEHDQRHIVRDEVIPVRGGVAAAVTGLKSLRGIHGRPEIVSEPSGDEASTELGEPVSRTSNQGLTTEVKYETSRQQETVSVATGAVKRLTVSVLVPLTATADVRRGISNAVGNAVGINIERGDTVSVTGVPTMKVNPADQPPAAAVLGNGSPMASLFGEHVVLWIAVIAAVLGGYLSFAIVEFRRSRRRLSDADLDRFKQQLKAWIESDSEPDRGATT